MSKKLPEACEDGEKPPKCSIVGPADALNPLWLVRWSIADMGGSKIVEECLNVVLSYKRDIEGDAYDICPAQETAELSAVILHCLWSDGDL